VSQAEYKHILAELDDPDPIVGLWYLSGETRVYEGDSLIQNVEDPFLDYWYIVPDDIGYKVCHSEFTDIQDFNATYLPIGDSTYHYAVNYSSQESAEAKAVIFDSAQGSSYDKFIAYSLNAPPEKAKAMGAKDNQVINWVFYLWPLELEELYYTDTLAQASITNHLDSMYWDKMFTETELQEIEETSRNEFVERIRTRLDSEDFGLTIGCKDFPMNIAEDRFFVTSVNELFPGRVSYFIIFDKFDSNVWRVDFSIDDKGRLIELLSFNESLMYNEASIRLLKEFNGKYGETYWR